MAWAAAHYTAAGKLSGTCLLIREGRDRKRRDLFFIIAAQASDMQRIESLDFVHIQVLFLINIKT